MVIIIKGYANWIKITPFWLKKLHNLYFRDAFVITEQHQFIKNMCLKSQISRSSVLMWHNKWMGMQTFTTNYIIFASSLVWFLANYRQLQE